MKNTKDVEHKVQCAICEYLDILRIFYFAVPNGSYKSKAAANKFKREGLKAGIPDLCILKNGKAYFIEVKKPKTDTPQGRVSSTQAKVFKQIQDVGCEVEVVRSVADVRECLHKWGFGD